MDKLLESDPELARFVAEMEQGERLKKATYKMANDCWDLCVTNPNVSRFDSKTESCLVNCVERFIDSSSYIMTAFANKAKEMGAGSSDFGGGSSLGGGLGSESEMYLDDKFSSSSSSSSSSGETPKKSGGFKFW